ncbi:hypothetical protein MMC14_007763 [Varicellaria rhodocarpa]|nr:hypothetical protein [Varicellaria rhodocarpa]
MISQEEAMVAKEGMEHHNSTDVQLRVHSMILDLTEIGIIPIERLTDADLKWLLTTDYGGTDGKPVESGLVVEEPDIGTGISSKAWRQREKRKGKEMSRYNK